MKTIISKVKSGLVTATLLFSSLTEAQINNRKACVISMDAVNVYDPISLGNMLRLELEKLNQYQVMDKYDVATLVKKNNLTLEGCFGKICLAEIGKTLNAEKMISGSAEAYGEQLIITIRVIDVATESIEKIQVMEFLNLPKEIQSMLNLTLRKMFALEIDELLLSNLTRKDNFDNTINNPYKDRLRLDGPRMGFQFFTGEEARSIKRDKSQGGYGGYPAMFQFGYQFEKQYLNEGNVQALVEFVPMISGLDQGLFIPSMSVLHGLRHNSGWEFAFGPTIALAQMARVKYEGGSWMTEDDLKNNGLSTEGTKLKVDSRGDFRLTSAFVFAAGKTFKSGRLNIPVNIFVVPSKDSPRMGVSFGFNAKKKK